MNLFEYLSLNHYILCQFHITDLNIIKKPRNRRTETGLTAFLQVIHSYFRILYWKKMFFRTTKSTKRMLSCTSVLLYVIKRKSL